MMILRTREVLGRLDRIERKLDKLIGEPNSTNMEALMADIKMQIEALAEQARVQGTVIESVKTIVAGLRQQILDAQGQMDAAGEAAASAALGQLAANFDENTGKLLGIAAAENTEAGDEPHAAGM